MAEKRYPPTQKRLRDARKRGEVVYSRDVSSTLGFVLVLAAVWVMGSGGFSALRELWLHATGAPLLNDPARHLPALLRHTATLLLWAVVPLLSVAALGGLAGSFLQVGGLAAWQRLKPDVNRLNPARGLERLLSLRSLVDLAKMVVKTLLLAVLMFFVVRGFVGTALKLGYAAPSTTMAVGARVIIMCFAWAAVIYAAMAAVDYVHQRFEFMKQLRMSIEDLRNEHKDAEGDPLNASRRRTEHYETIYASLADRVRASSAVIHSARVAVALRYDGEGDLPRVMARGQGEIAAQMRRAADEASIPLAFDPTLAEQLYEDVPQGRPIPRSLFAPVAALMRWAQGQE
jgi:type III secretion protein U